MTHEISTPGVGMFMRLLIVTVKQLKSKCPDPLGSKACVFSYKILPAQI